MVQVLCVSGLEACFAPCGWWMLFPLRSLTRLSGKPGCFFPRATQGFLTSNMVPYHLEGMDPDCLRAITETAPRLPHPTSNAPPPSSLPPQLPTFYASSYLSLPIPTSHLPVPTSLALRGVLIEPAKGRFHDSHFNYFLTNSFCHITPARQEPSLPGPECS